MSGAVIAALIAERNRAEADESAARDEWNAINRRMIDRFSPHKIGDIATYTKGGKTHRLRVDRIVVGRLMGPRSKAGEAELKDLSFCYYGVAVLKSGKPGVARGEFIINFTDIKF